MTGRSHALDLVPGLRELAQAQLGVVRRDQLRDLGVTRHHIRRQLDAERWRPIGPHVIVLRTGGLSRRQSMGVGVVNAGRESRLALWSALEHRGLRAWDRASVFAEAPRGRRIPQLDGVVVREVADLPAAELTGGWPAAAGAARAAVLAASLERTDSSAAGLLLAVAQQRLATPAEMRAELDGLWRPRRAALLRHTLDDACAGAESLAEVDVVSLVRAAGLPEPRRQVVVSTPEGVFHLDLLVELPDGRLLDIEVDGPHHVDPRRRARDAARDAALIALGYVVLRLPSAEARTDPEGVVRRLRRIGGLARAS